MEKSPEAFRTISEVSEELRVPAHVLRFWETRFVQIKPVKHAGGRRYYRPADVALLLGIKKLLHEDGLTIRGVQKILREHGVKFVSAIGGQQDGGGIAAYERGDPAISGPLEEAPMLVDADALPPQNNVVALKHSGRAKAAPAAPSPSLLPSGGQMALDLPEQAPAPSEKPPLAARLRQLPPGRLAHRQEAAAALAARLRVLHTRLSQAAGPYRQQG